MKELKLQDFKDPACFTEICTSLRKANDTCSDQELWIKNVAILAQISWIFLPHLRDEEFSCLNSLLKTAYDKSDKRPGFTQRAVEVDRARMWCREYDRMSDSDEVTLRLKLPKIKNISEKKLGNLIYDLRECWGRLFESKEQISPAFPKSGKIKGSRLENVKYFWNKLTPYERGFLFEILQEQTALDPSDLLDVLSRISKACSLAEEKLLQHGEEIVGLTRRKNFTSVFSLAVLYERYTRKKPSYNPSGPFATFVRIVMSMRVPSDPNSRKESVQRALEAYSKDRYSNPIIHRHPDFYCIRLLDS